MTRLVLLSAVSALPLLVTPAFAACAPDSPVSGAFVLCTATDTDGFDFDTLNDINLTVIAGASVTNSGEAVKTADYLTLLNLGVIESTGDDAVQTDNGLTLTNAGTINSLAKDGVNAGDDAMVLNLGTITGLDEGVQGGNNLTVTNSGTIIGQDEGVTGDDGFTLTNLAGGVIQANDDAVQIANGARIYNSGLIENIGTDLSDPQDAVDIDSGEVWNFATGTILSTLDAAIDFDSGETGGGIVQNFGKVSGTIGVLVDPGNLSAQDVTNHAGAFLEGTSGIAVDLAGGNDSLTLFAGSTMLGGALMGDGDDTLALNGSAFGQIAGGALLDGGADTDTVTFTDYLFADITKVSVDDTGILGLSLANSLGSAQLNLFGWEIFTFGDGSYALADITALAPVPLPAGVLLLGGALAGLGLMRRRRG